MGRILASVGIFVKQSDKKDTLSGLCQIDNVEEVYDVAGEFDILSIVSVSSLEELRDTVENKIRHLKGVSSVIANIILAPHIVRKTPKVPKTST